MRTILRLHAPPRLRLPCPLTCAKLFAQETAMAEFGLAILFVGILAGLDRRRRDAITDQIRRFLDWLEKSS